MCARDKSDYHVSLGIWEQVYSASRVSSRCTELEPTKVEKRERAMEYNVMKGNQRYLFAASGGAREV